MLFVFVLTFLLLEWLLSENALVGNLVGRFWSIPCQNSSSVPWATLVPSQRTSCAGTNLKLRRWNAQDHGVNETRRPPALRPGDEEDEAEEDEAILVAVDYATSLTFRDEQHATENDVAAGVDDNAGNDNHGMNNDNGSNDRGKNDGEGEQQC